MKKKKKIILIIISVLAFITVLPLAGLLIFLLSLGGDYLNWVESGQWEVPYRTPTELSEIAGVNIPRAELIDSSYVDNFSDWAIKALFSVPEKDHKSLLKQLSQKSASAGGRWQKDDAGYSMYFYPDMNDDDWSDGIDERMVELDGKMVSDWDGIYMEMTVPADSCRIILEYGWRR